MNRTYMWTLICVVVLIVLLVVFCRDNGSEGFRRGGRWWGRRPWGRYGRGFYGFGRNWYPISNYYAYYNTPYFPYYYDFPKRSCVKVNTDKACPATYPTRLFNADETPKRLCCSY